MKNSHAQHEQHAESVRAAAEAVGEQHYPFSYGGRTYCPVCDKTWPCIYGTLVEGVLDGLLRSES